MKPQHTVEPYWKSEKFGRFTFGGKACSIHQKLQGRDATKVRMDIISVLMFDLQDIRQDNVVMRDWAKCSIRSSSLNETQKKSYPIAILNVIFLFCIKNSTSLQKLGRHASRRVRSVWKSLGRVSFGSKKFGLKISLSIFSLNWIALRK